MNKRQFFKLMLLVLLGYSAAHLLIFFLGDELAAAFDALLLSFPFVLAILGALSFAMFTYVDNTAKDLTDLRNEVDRERYKKVQEQLSCLKREILHNAGLVIALFVLERLIKALDPVIMVQQGRNSIWLMHTITTSARFACFLVAIYSTISQVRGYIVAVEFRELIAKNRK